MADRVINIIIKADGTAAVQSFNQVSNAGTSMAEDVTKGTSKISASLARFAQRVVTQFKSLISNVDNFKLRMSEVDRFLQQGLNLASLYAMQRTMTGSLDAAELMQNSLKGLASTARYTGDGIEESFREVEKFTADGLVNIQETSQALKNLELRGYGLEKSIDILERLKDSAAFNRQSHLSMGAAIVSATEGLKNENSILVDNAGVTKNVSVMWKEYAAQIGKSVEHMTIAEKREAEYQGIMRETEAQIGNSKLATEGLTGAKAQLNNEIFKLKASFGETLIPAFLAFGKAANWVLENVLKPFLGGIELLGAGAGAWAARFGAIWDWVTSGFTGGTEKINNELAAIDDAFNEYAEEIVKKWEGKLKIPEIGKDTGNRRQDIQDEGDIAKAASDKIKKLTDEYEALRLSLERQIQMVGLDNLGKKLLEASNDFEDLKKKFGEAKAQKIYDLQIKLLDKEEFQKTLDSVKGAFKNLEDEFIPSLEERIKAEENYMKSVIDAYDTRKDLEEKLTDATATEQAKRLKDEEKVLEDMLRLNFLADQTLEERLKNKERIYAIYAEHRAKIEAEYAPKTFSQGVDEGMDEYLKSLEWGFDRGKDLAREAFTSMEGFFEDLFTGRVKLSWQNLLGWMGGLFAKFLAEMTTKMIAQTGIIQQIMGTVGSAAPGAGGALSEMGGLSTLLRLGVGLGAGRLFGGGTGANVGGMAGGFAGGALASSTLMTTGVMASTMINAGMVGAVWGSIVPILGTVVGALIGAGLGKLIGDLLGSDTIQQKFRVVGGEVHTYGDMPKGKQQELLNSLQPAYDAFVGWAEDMGLAAENLFDVGRWGLEDKSKITSKELLNSFYRGLLDALGLDTEIFKPYQKSGEKYYETIQRVMQALAEGIPSVVASIDDYIRAIESSDDAIAQFRDRLRDMDAGIDDLRDSLNEATDPSDAMQYANQLKQAIYERYMLEKQLIEGLVASIRALKDAYFEFTLGLQQKIDDLTGSADSIGMLWDRMIYIVDQLGDSSLSASERLDLLNQGIGYLDQWVSANVAAIQAQYALQQQAIEAQIEAVNAEIEALNQQKAAISEQISGLQEQLDLSKRWKSVLDSVTQSIRDMKTTFSQRDDLEQLDYLRSEIDTLFGKYQGATGEEKVGYAQELQSIIQQYLTMAADTLQLPSLAYGAVYDDMLAILETIQGDAIAGSATQEDILAQISALQQESNSIDMAIAQRQDQIAQLNQQIADLNVQMQADIQAIQQQAATYYEWAQTEGAQLYEDAIAEQTEKLQEILGDQTAEEYLADLQLAAVTELVQIRDILEDIRAAFGNIPQSASGAYFTKPSLTWVAEKGPEWVIPDGKVAGGVTVQPQTVKQEFNISVPVSVSIQEVKDRKTVHQLTQEIGRTAVDAVSQSLRGGRLRVQVQDINRGR